MSKRLLPLVFLICSSFASLAQATLTAANFNPVAGDGFVSRNCDTTGVTPGPNGANQVWNFSSLIDTLSIDSGIVTPCAYLFPTCSWAIGSTIGITSTTGSSFIRNYLYEDNNKLSQYGIYLSATDNIVFSDPMDQLHYPFTYNSTFTDYFAGIVSFLPTGATSPVTAHQHGTETVTCDGYGVLVLPRGITDSNTLRVHTNQPYADSAFLFGNVFAGIDSFQFDTYTWYTPGTHTALLTIQYAWNVTLNTVSKLVSYSQRPIINTPPPNNSVAPLAIDESSLQLYPNPATGTLNIRYTAGTPGKVHITLVDMIGREIAVIGDQPGDGVHNLHYNTASLPKGLYIVRLQSEGQTLTKKLELR